LENPRGLTKLLYAYLSVRASQREITACIGYIRPHAISGRAPHDPVTQSGILNQIYELQKAAKTDRAIDLLFEKIDDLLSAGTFSVCDSVLDKADLRKLDVDLTVAFLVITLPAKKRLERRAKFFNKARKAFTTKYGRSEADRILQGLK
jgi:hypothetical protein